MDELNGPKKITEGQIVLSNSNAIKSPSVFISDLGVVMHSSDVKTGVKITESGNTIQGLTYFTNSGKDIKKGEFTENPKSAKTYTYTETIEMEAMIKEKLEELKRMAGLSDDQIAGLDIDMDSGGSIDMMTTFDGYPLIHSHKMLFKHVHKLEPAYLYRVPSYIRLFKGFTSLFQDFLGA